MSIFQKPYNQGGNSLSGNTGSPAAGTELQRIGGQRPQKLPDVGIGGLRYITERHIACVFILDTSGSMDDDNAIGQLNAGIEAFKRQTMTNTDLDAHTQACIDVALVTFGPEVRVVQDFTPVSEMITPKLTADGGTPMGGAINTALDMIAAQKEKYNELGTPYYRPWIFCITDGQPNDDYAAAAQRLRQMEEASKVVGYCVGVKGFDRQTMAQIFNPQRVLVLENMNFPSLFVWLSSSIAAVRESNPDGGPVITVDTPDDLHRIDMFL